MQLITSANTSLNQIPKTGKLLSTMGIKEKTVILDYGCGGFNKFSTYCKEELKLTYFGYDPYWKNEEENNNALYCQPEVITCNNVFNVIEENNVLEMILDRLKGYQCKVIIKVYEGNKTGIGKVSKKDCFQRNMRAKDYLPIIGNYFENIVIKGDIIICQ